MSNNYWQSQNNQSGPVGSNNPPRKSGLLSNYARQQSASGQLPSPNNPMSLPGGPPPLSPLPPAPGPQGPSPFPPATGRPSREPLPPSLDHGSPFIARPMQMVQRWSNKMASLRKHGLTVDPNPLVLYRNLTSPAQPETRPPRLNPKPWRRSHTQRIAHLRKRRQERVRRSHPGGRRIATIVFAIVGSLLAVLISSSAGYAYNFYQSELPQVQNLSNMQIAQSTRIYDRHGTLLDTIYANGTWGESGRSTPISYNYLPRILQDAQTSAEDPTFWTNNGIDPQGMLRALTEYFSHGGQVAGGGSTMTQQLIKNLSNNTQDTLQRKASEAALAIGLTEQYPKWKIMEMYFNDTPYGAQEKGVEAAVEDYFGLKTQCSSDHTQCIPAVAFLDRDLSACKVTQPQIDETSCKSDPVLALARSALLAGIPQNPTHFDPSVSQENRQNVLTNRVPYVLNQMIADGVHIDLGLGTNNKDYGPVTAAMVPEVEAIIGKMKIVGFQPTMLAPHFVNWVIDTLSNSLGNGDYDTGHLLLENSGLNIYTTLDLNLEKFVEKDVQHNLRDRVYQPYTGWGPLNTVYNVNDSAVVVEDAKTGEILAMDGSANYNDKTASVSGQVNAALAYRQPGSSIKPLVYATALEKGWYPGIKLIDGKTYFPDGGNTALPVGKSTYTPTDYMNSYHPNLPTDIRISLANSFNIPAIKALMFSGLDDVVSMARRLGITAIDHDLATDYPGETPNQAFGPSFALGTAGIPLIQMVGAYQTFADNGAHIPYHNILNIWDNYGRNLYHFDPIHPNSAQVLSPQITFLLNNMLTDNAARHYEFTGIDTLTMDDWTGNHPVGAKTGTTDAFVDNWTIGYTTSVVVGVWSGNADGDKDPMARGVIGISGAGPTWHDVIEYASGRSMLGMTPDLTYPTDDFPQPTGVLQAPVNPVNGLQGNGVTDWMLQSEQPQQNGLACPPTTTDPTDPNNPNPTPAASSSGCPPTNPGNGTSSNGTGNNGGDNGNNPNNGNYNPFGY